MHDPDNIVLIGMPGVGKSTAGVLLAKRLSRDFVDTDVMIQAAEKRRLQDIIDTDGLDAFRRLEERQVLSLDCRGHVVATGGSVVYSPRAMVHLGDGGTIVHLELPLDVLRKRLTDLDSRGVVMAPGETLGRLYDERMPLYRRWADVTVSCEGLSHEEVVDAIVEALDK
ncbi:MAG: shikimate kinase [Candidatus Brocadiia bacterium]